MNKENLLFNLKYVRRYSGVRLITPESDVDHTFDMIAIALQELPAVAKKYKTDYGFELDFHKLVYKIAIHDMGEAFSTDIPRPFKYCTPELKKEVDRAESILMHQNLNKHLVADIESAKDDTVEGFWVRVLDLVQAGYKMVDETYLGNQYMRGQLLNVVDTLSLIMNEEGIRQIEKDYLQEKINYFQSEYDGK